MSSLKLAMVAVAALAVAACGGDNLVLPDEGTPAAISIVRGNNQSATVGTKLPDSLVVKVVDGEGRPVPSQSVSFEVVAGGGSVDPDDARTDANGLAGTSWTLGTGAGAQQVLAKPVGNGTPANVQVTFSANAGASTATDLAMVSGDDQTATAGTALPDSLVVRATDGASNPVAGVTVTWTVTGGGAVSATTVTTGPDGRSAVRRTLGPSAGAQTTIATAAGLDGSPVTFGATATVGSAGRLVIERQPSATASSGTPFTVQPRVQLADANGNPVSTSGISVQAQIVSGPAGASLAGASTATTGGGGLATFQNLGLAGPAGSYTINFVVPNRDDISGSPPTNSILLSAGSAARLAFATQPSNVTAGGTITPAVTVRIEDALGNPVSTATNQVTVALGANPGGATLGGTKTVAAVGGVATFSTLTVDRPGSGYTLVASATGLSGATSSQFSVSTGAAANIAANSATTLTGTAGSPVTPVPSVKVTDGAGNGVGGVSVTFAVTAGGGSVSGETQTTDASGVATVGSWVLGTTAGSGNNTLTATSAGLSGSPVTFTASATAGSAGKLTIEGTQPSSGQSGAVLTPSFVLQLRDENNNTVAMGGITITAAIASGPTATLDGETAITNTQGRATFSSLEIDGPSGTYTLTFGGPNLTGVTSEEIDLGSGAATRLGLATDPTSPAQSGVIFPSQPVVRLEDGSGNPVGTAGVNVSVTLQTCGGRTLGGDTEVSTNSSGEATFTDLRITGTVGNCSLLFAATGLTSVSAPVVLGPGPVSATNSTISASPGTITAGGSGSTITVTARDASNNLVSGATVNFAMTSGTGTLTPGSTTTNASGVATTSYTGTVSGAKSVGATAGGVTLSDQAAVTVSPAAASNATSTLEASSTTIAAGESTTLTLTLRDEFNNPVGSQAVTFATSSTGTFGAGPHATDASGVETTTYTSTTTGNHDIEATAGGITESVQITVTAASPSAANSTVAVDQSTITAGGAGTTVTVTVRDASNNPVPGVNVVFEAVLGAGSFAPGSASTNASGVATSNYTSTAAGAKTLGATAGGVALTDQAALNVNPAVPDAAQSSLAAEPADVTAGSPSTLTFTLRDQYGNPISGQSVTFGADLTGTFDVNPVNTSALGTAVTTFTPSAAGTHNLDATVGAFTETAQLTVSAAGPDAVQSSVAAESPRVVDQASVVTVTVRDQFGNPVPGISVTLAESGGGGAVVQPVAATGADGIATGSFSASVAGPYVINAEAGGVGLAQTAPIVVQ